VTCSRWLLVLACMGAALAETPKIAGDYSGMLGPLHLRLHLKTAADGAIEGTLDSLDQGAKGLPCANFHLVVTALSFEVPSVGGAWHGTVSGDAATLTGSWSQGEEMLLVFRRDEPPEIVEPTRVDGIWLGTLDAGGVKLRIQVQVRGDRAGKEHCSLDSLDQGAMGLPCDKEQFDANRNHFSFEVPVVKGRWSGTLSKDGNELDGTWSQGQNLPLRMTRQTVAVT
jgi:serine-type D-Ala-D-Ala carboxypeptidase/endopeptidase